MSTKVNPGTVERKWRGTFAAQLPSNYSESAWFLEFSYFSVLALCLITTHFLPCLFRINGQVYDLLAICSWVHFSSSHHLSEKRHGGKLIESPWEEDLKVEVCYLKWSNVWSPLGMLKESCWKLWQETATSFPSCPFYHTHWKYPWSLGGRNRIAWQCTTAVHLSYLDNLIQVWAGFGEGKKI